MMRALTLQRAFVPLGRGSTFSHVMLAREATVRPAPNPAPMSTWRPPASAWVMGAQYQGHRAVRPQTGSAGVKFRYLPWVIR
jgi:hypothetical protein